MYHLSTQVAHIDRSTDLFDLRRVHIAREGWGLGHHRSHDGDEWFVQLGSWIGGRKSHLGKEEERRSEGGREGRSEGGGRDGGRE